MLKRFYQILVSVLFITSLLSVTPVAAMGASWVGHEYHGLHFYLPPSWSDPVDPEAFQSAIDDNNTMATDPAVSSLKDGITQHLVANPDLLLLYDTFTPGTSLNLTTAPVKATDLTISLETLAGMIPDSMKKMGETYGVNYDVLEVSVIQLPAGKALRTYNKVSLGSTDLNPTRQYQYIFITDKQAYTLTLTTSDAFFDSMQSIFDRIANTIRIEGVTDSWTPYVDPDQKVSLKLNSQWETAPSLPGLSASATLSFKRIDTPDTLVVEITPLESNMTLSTLKKQITDEIKQADQELLSLDTLYLPSGSFLRAHLKTNIANQAVLQEQYLYVTIYGTDRLTFRFSIPQDKFGIYAALYGQIMATVWLPASES